MGLVRAGIESREVQAILNELTKIGYRVDISLEVSAERIAEPAPASDLTALDAEFLRSMRIEP